MKKLMSIILILAMLSCFACSNKTAPGGQDAAAVTDAPTAQPTAEPTQAPKTEPTEESAPLTCYAYTFSSNGGAEAPAVRELTDELRIWKLDTEAIYRDDAPQTMDVVFDGVSYHGNYNSSTYVGCSSFMFDEYICENGSFEVNSETGETVHFGIGPGFFASESAKPELADPKAETLALARDFVADRLQAEGYELFDSSITLRSDDPNDAMRFDLYLYIFGKCALGEQTNDRIEVNVTSKGTVCSWRVYDAGAFDPLPEDISRFEGVDLDAMIEAKVNECLHRDDLKYADLDIRDRYFCKSPVDGSSVMYVYVWVPKELLGTDYSSEIYIIIK